MAWAVLYHDACWAVLQRESEAIQDAVFAAAELLKYAGPQLGRPYTETLKGSRYPNMKELRVTLPDGEWRIAYAFDPARIAIVLTGASKSGVSQKRFYDQLICCRRGGLVQPKNFELETFHHHGCFVLR